MSQVVTALDLFAGTGWGVACKRLGIREMGVEIMPEAIATRDANGMATIYRDVWDGLEGKFHVPNYQLLIASPPCQTFSLAGKGAGRAALNEVLEAIELNAYKDPTQLREFGEKHDPRTALVLAPLAHVWRDRPQYVAFEQVPTVLPVWEACAVAMQEWGYETQVAILNAEQYGVPQTRKRAILVARLNAPVSLPTPTHSRYYSRTPEKLDTSVKKWVSMAEALGWGMTNRPSITITGGSGRQGGPDPLDGGSGARATIRNAKESGAWEGDPARRATLEEAAALQTYPVAIKNMGKGMVERHGERPGRAGDSPAFTIRASAGGTEPGGFVLQEANGETRKLEVAEAAALQSYPSEVTLCHGVQKNSARRLLSEPAATIAFGHDSASVGFAGTDVGDHLDLRAAKSDGRFTPITVTEASLLQSYPAPPFVWCGNKGKQFLQIGNAVPPLLAEAILAALLDRAA